MSRRETGSSFSRWGRRRRRPEDTVETRRERELVYARLEVMADELRGAADELSGLVSDIRESYRGDKPRGTS